MIEKDIIIGISGASGSIFGIKIIELLSNTQHIKTHLVMSKAAEITIKTELGYSAKDIQSKVDFYYSPNNIGASIASGSFKTSGMIIAPCSIKTMSEIACGITGNLMSRAADVCLKEKKPLVLGVREMPFHSGHLYNMAKISDMGGYIAPPVPAFYTNPKTVDDIVTQICCRWLSLISIDLPEKISWQGLGSFDKTTPT